MITVLGMGFVGLTTALGLCEKKQIVYGYDINKEKIEKLKRGEIPFYEPHLKNYLEKHLGENLKLVNNLESAIENSHIIFFCMGTPSKENGSCNLEYMFNGIDETLKCMKNKPHKVFVIKSTIPPSTTEQEIIPYIKSLGFKVGEDLGIVNNPEFLREGHAWNDFMNPDRIIIGESDKKSGDLIEELYQLFHAPIFRVSLNTSEFTKYLSNKLLASLIVSQMNFP
ncbi:nucleotide sugar dehydrogenase [Peribacillus sp. NPDC094092]|uniref:nucleotide sugar dehydrogenase n=1 Tax=Peribacillus sp. NPDC094092 TaxID=3390611 RepID=UPI003CFF7C48